MSGLRSIVLGALVLALVGCASAPRDTGFLDQAEAAIAAAEAAGAVEHAPLEIRFAREKLVGARLAAADRDYDRAHRLVRQSLINSELATVKSAAAKAREATRAARRANDELRRDLEAGGGAG